MKSRIEQIRERMEKAGTGPWAATKTAKPGTGGIISGPEDMIGIVVPWVDAQFVAHSRQDIPYLLDRLEAARGACKAALEAEVYVPTEKSYDARKKLKAQLEAALKEAL